ncbi:hypothetical protein RGQ29_026024 [Quercus rubra]|uniref:Expansin n=1 Tax=Quercus rubra TaxID=3512 RepID=A0AAN7IQW1_QUERU|nr:hypothetical protein RGQ29_026024 [Quercus rubra]
MALPLQVLSASLLLLIAVPDIYATVHHGVHHAVGSRAHHRIVLPKHHRPKFKPGPWKQAHATFYEGGPGSFGGACGYDDVVKEGYGLDSTAAVSNVLFNTGQACGACFEIKCINSPQWCKPGQQSLFVTATNQCPPNYYESSDNGGWCNEPREHFDLAEPAFLKIAQYKGGIVPVQYRRVPCKKQGGIRFTITGNPYFNQVLVWNVGGAGDVVSLQVKGNKNLKWTQMKRSWGQKWETDAMLVGESLTFRVRASDGRYSTAWHIAPKNWQFGQTYEGKNFK